jgi:UDP-N-acetylglucosamine 2-epimerase (non-hydrolysing)
MKIMTVVGARPNFMKAGPIMAAIRRYNAESAEPIIDHLLVHTGQHYDARMSDSFFTDLDLPAPDIQLGVGPGTQAAQTGEILKRFEEVALRERPDAVIVVGDVNSTVACALATSKLAFDSTGRRPLLAHVEAGLRSFDRSMPEEVNRVVTDHISDLLFVTEESGIRNLHNEGIAPEAVHFVGNTMIDSLFAFQEKADASKILERLGLRSPVNGHGGAVKRFALFTLHRPSNVDHPETFRNILEGLSELGEDCPIVFPVHPRTQKKMAEISVQFAPPPGAPGTDSDGRAGCAPAGIMPIEPLGYLDFVCLMKNAAVVVTDSGGVQEETTCLGTPCVTVRENTERPVTVEHGTNAIAGTAKENIQAVIRQQMRRQLGGGVPEKWDGHAGKRIIEILVRTLSKRNSANPEVQCVTA